jgi:hypothetical protein
MTVAVVAIAAPSAVAQTTAVSGISIRPVTAGECAVVTVFAQRLTGERVEIQLQKAEIDSVDVSATPGQNRTKLPRRLKVGEEVRVIQGGTELAKVAVVAAKPGAPLPNCPTPPSVADDEDDDVFEATWYLGEAIDTFAPNQVASYQNPGAAGTIENRLITGANFEYRMFGKKKDVSQLWWFGETLHGVRSVDVNCTPEPPKQPPPVCTNGSFGDQSLYLIRNASSLEAFFGPRLDLYTLQPQSESAAKVYVTARFGFVAVAGAPEVYATHHVGGGLRMPSGAFEGSQVEVGWGKNEMMVSRSWNRLKIDGTLSFDVASAWRDEVPYLKKLVGSVRFFVQIFVDNDLRGTTSDSVQTFFGFEIDVRNAFGGR